jgi:hypothetical protein
MDVVDCVWHPCASSSTSAGPEKSGARSKIQIEGPSRFHDYIYVANF